MSMLPGFILPKIDCMPGPKFCCNNTNCSYRMTGHVRQPPLTARLPKSISRVTSLLQGHSGAWASPPISGSGTLLPSCIHAHVRAHTLQSPERNTSLPCQPTATGVEKGHVVLAWTWLSCMEDTQTLCLSGHSQLVCET